MINEQTFKDAYIAKLTGIAEYKNENEIWWDSGLWVDSKITIEFLNNSIDIAVVRHYYPNGIKKWEANYEYGVLHGACSNWYIDGVKAWENVYDNGECICIGHNNTNWHYKEHKWIFDAYLISIP